MSNMRLSGLASGMDTESMVKKLMQFENTKVDKLKQQKEKLEWKRDGYRSVNTLLLNFRNSLTNMKLSTSYRARTTTSSDDARVTATANSTAGIGSFNISEVKQLASSANRISGKISDTKIDTKASLYGSNGTNVLSGIDWKQGSVESASVGVTSAGNTFTIKSDGSSANLKADAITSASVKVGTKAYKVVTGEGVTAKAGEVHVSANGTLTFGDTLTAGSTIRINYVADSKTDTNTLSKGATTFNLTKGSIADVQSLKIGEKDYTFERNPIVSPATVGELKVDSTGNVKIFESGNEVGVLNVNSGKITLNTPVSTEEATSYTATYTQNYFSTSMSTETSTGTKTESFIFDGSKTLNDVVSTVNSSSLGVSVFFDEYTQKITMNRTEQGSYGSYTGDENNKVYGEQIKFGSDNFFNDVLKFGVLKEVANPAFNANADISESNSPTKMESTGYGATIVNGQNAQFTINGLTTERNSNTFSLNGVTFTLNKTFESTAGAVTIGVNNDASKVVENVKKFVEEYNTLIAAINTLTTETLYRDYAPLTDSERETLSDKQQEQWESKARSGLLRNDTMLTSVLSAMRLDFSTPVNNSALNSNFNQLAKIGIKTTANYLEGGKLEIDEAALLKAIEEDPAGVEGLFNVNGTTDGSQGIVQRLYDTVNNTMKQITERAGSALTASNSQFTLGKELTSIEKRITSFEDRLKTIEDRYWKQFGAMEKAISNANAQSTQIMSMFNSGS